ncbi:hypothetical protein ACXG8O_002705 [Citrobacter youngae]|uniref:hypothetical protein n=1 Tax=Citrobacter sp. FDAARGOS_156 TaxID=1702170 RepID=UPI00076B3420|nr:hypothetical protein [Citrobacter sp. FDAARGOS_156]AMH14138.1 hypothetical protein AL515_09830 [Citrobacter sp. FDAARGOS_156]
MFKNKIRKVVRKFAQFPVLGKIIRVSVAIFRSPLYRAESIELRHRVDFLEEQIRNLQGSMNFNNVELIKLRQESDNFFKSIPFEVRRLRREVNNLEKNKVM